MVTLNRPLTTHALPLMLLCRVAILTLPLLAAHAQPQAWLDSEFPWDIRCEINKLPPTHELFMKTRRAELTVALEA
jgi:hypothetical protein